jgi:hypothetical protein
VLTGPTNLFAGVFPSADAKDAFQFGVFETAPGVERRLLDVLRPKPPTEAAAPLVLRSAAPTIAGFLTDRGTRLLAAWRVTMEGINEPFLVLDPDLYASAWPRGWDPERSGYSTSHATLAADGRTVALHFAGSWAGEYAAEVYESRTAVVVLAVLDRMGFGFVPASARPRTVTSQLAAPLGARVLVEPNGLPMQVAITSALVA